MRCSEHVTFNGCSWVYEWLLDVGNRGIDSATLLCSVEALGEKGCMRHRAQLSIDQTHAVCYTRNEAPSRSVLDPAEWKQDSPQIYQQRVADLKARLQARYKGCSTASFEQTRSMLMGGAEEHWHKVCLNDSSRMT